jgi:hypothetical protein
MGKKIALAALLIGMMGSPSIGLFAQQTQVPPRCLHGPAEQQNQRARREQAVRVAQEINRAENAGAALMPGQRRTYRPLDQLPGIPPTPAGFSGQFNTDGKTYTFALKDTLDACHYAIFSDQESWIYEATPRTGFQVRPAETR